MTERTADLTRANDEIQRFAYIVSHDLRSPLVNVMGFTAELETATGQLRALVDRAEAEAPHLLASDDAAAAREDLPEAIGFIRTSTQKMDRLINAILQLSRQGRRVLMPAPVDVASVVEDDRRIDGASAGGGRRQRRRRGAFARHRLRPARHRAGNEQPGRECGQISSPRRSGARHRHR